MTQANRTKILEAFITRKDAEYFAKLVDNKTIAENDYNIAVSNYVIAEDTHEVIDITKLNKEITHVVKRQQELRIAIDEMVADIEGK